MELIEMDTIFHEHQVGPSSFQLHNLDQQTDMDQVVWQEPGEKSLVRNIFQIIISFVIRIQLESCW